MYPSTRVDGARPWRHARAPRRPSNAFRRANAPRPPSAVILAFQGRLEAAARAFAGAVLAVIEPSLADYARPEPERTDAIPSTRVDGKDPTALMGRARRAGLVIAKGVDASGDKTATKAMAHAKREDGRLGISLEKEPDLGPLIDKWRKENVAEITKMGKSQLDKVEAILKGGGTRRVESIAKDIHHQLGHVTKSRARLIARSQVMKLHAKITKHRHKAAGINRFVWTTSNDERVRPEHDELDGEEFDYDDPPDEGLPGEPPACRCVAFPVLDDED